MHLTYCIKEQNNTLSIGTRFHQEWMLLERVNAMVIMIVLFQDKLVKKLLLYDEKLVEGLLNISQNTGRLKLLMYIRQIRFSHLAR